MTKWFTLAAGIALTASAAADAQDGGRTGFAVAGQNFTVAVPEGYCVPEGADAALSKAIADLDTLNLTHVSLRLCEDPEGDYSIVKSQRDAPPLGIPRAMFIALAAKQLESEEAQKQLAQGIDTGSKDIASGTGDQMKVSSGSARASGFDDYCVYILGNVVIAAGGENVSTNFATCLTLAGGRVFAVHSYSDAGSSVSDDALKERSRGIATTIAVAP